MMVIRSYIPTDLDDLHAINVAGEPGVGAVSKDKLATIIASGVCFVATRNDVILGFILLHAPSAEHTSANFKWFCERYESFIYVDRIAIAEHGRNQGVGAALYEYAFTLNAENALLIGCEVNTIPPNPASLRFHERLGFLEVGTHTFSPHYAVSYLAKRLRK